MRTRQQWERLGFAHWVTVFAIPVGAVLLRFMGWTGVAAGSTAALILSVYCLWHYAARPLPSEARTPAVDPAGNPTAAALQGETP